MEYPSRYMEQAVEALSELPGVGRKTALRLALFLLQAPPETAERLAGAIQELQAHTRRCLNCHNICDDEAEQCAICRNPKRDEALICVVGDLPDVLAIEKTGQYTGRYHVLGGLISPMDGIGPDQLSISRLIERVRALPNDTEVMLALSASMDGETTAFYLARQLQPFGVKLSSLARGIPMGSDLEYTDEITLARSIRQRTAYSLPE